MIPSIWTGMYGDLPLPEALRMLSACGWKKFEISTEHLVSIEKSDNPESLIEKTQECIHQHKLSTPQAHGLLHANVAAMDKKDRERDIQRLLCHIEIAAKFSVKTIVIHPGGYNPDLQTEMDKILKLNVAAFRQLADAAAENGIRIGIENLPYPDMITANEVMNLIKEIDHPALGVNFDTSHANMCGINSAEMAHQFGDSLISTHLSDNNGSGDQHLVPGGGTIDWIGLMKALKDIGYKGDINLEIPGERQKNPELHRLKTCFALEVAEYLVGLIDDEENE